MHIWSLGSRIMDSLESMACVSGLGERLRDLLLKHGSFESVEIQLVKMNSQLARNEEEGGWENEITMAARGWTECHVCMQLEAVSLNPKNF